MISEALICGEATFAAPGQLLSALRPANYLFGSSGTGKSTIAKVLAEPRRYPGCRVEASDDCEVALFNEDFIQRTIRASPTMSGVFTIGDDAGEAAKAIADLELSRADLKAKSEDLRATLAEKQQELDAVSEEFKNAAWQSKKSVGKSLEPAFKGWNHSKEAFREKLLTVDIQARTESRALEDLQSEASLVFRDPPSAMDPIPSIAFEDDPDLEWSRVLSEPVLSSSSSHLSQLIEDLGNADWVHAGIPLLEHSKGRCPFCQQSTPNGLSESLMAVFDDRYERNMAEIRGFEDEFRHRTAVLIAGIESLSRMSHPLIDQASLAPLTERLRSNAAANTRLFAEKVSAPSRIVEYQSMRPGVESVLKLINVWDQTIVKNNKLVAEFAARRSSLVDATWMYLASVGAGPLLQTYTARSAGLQTAIENLTRKVRELESTRKQQLKEIRDLRRQVTSSLPTATALNDTLRAFGFDTFGVAVSGDGLTYRLTRSDGTAASMSLSEGERNFLAFLYFYHLVSGTLDAESAPLPRVVVVDDPVSSLDSQVLFVVSALIRRLVARAVDANDPGLRQIFVLTHNAYFHREVTFDKSRGDGCKKTESFWVVRRAAGTSIVEFRESNPVSTGYELLWDEVRNPSGNSTGVANAMRRILEYYFQILGGEKLQDIDQRFTGQDQLVCKALLSWSNQGSHLPADDMFVAAETYENHRYQEVFRRVFEETAHGAHYRMMMKIGEGS